MDIGDVISWVIIFVGWAVVSGQHNKRETRKETKERLQLLFKHLDEIEDAAFLYHTSKSPDPLLARRIRRDIEQISPRIRLAIRGPMKCAYSGALVRFRQSITLHNFDSATFAPKQTHEQLLDEIVSAKNALVYCLESAYNHAYP